MASPWLWAWVCGLCVLGVAWGARVWNPFELSNFLL